MANFWDDLGLLKEQYNGSKVTEDVHFENPAGTFFKLVKMFSLNCRLNSFFQTLKNDKILICKKRAMLASQVVKKQMAMHCRQIKNPSRLNVSSSQRLRKSISQLLKKGKTYY